MYEYKILRLTGDSTGMERVLNEHARDRWRVISVTNQVHQCIFYLEREKEINKAVKEPSKPAKTVKKEEEKAA